MFPRFHLFLQLGWLYCRSAVFNHQTFLLTLLACCILPVVGSSVICLAVFLQPAITSTLLCVYRRQPSLPHTPCSPVHLSPISSSAQHLHRPLPPQTSPPDCLLCVWGPEVKTMNIFRNFILETLMQKLTAASWSVSTNLKKKEESSRHWWKMKK